MRTLARAATFEQEIKKSRFIARAARLDDPDEGLDAVARLSIADARHNCWAYKVGTSYRFSDDGEPGGTAGRPILAAIEGQGLDHVVVVVARYFGGIKLGAGGLARAYGGTAAECLRTAEQLEVLPTVKLRVAVPFASTGAIHSVIDRDGVTKLAEDYDADGAILTLDVQEDVVPTLERALTDATRGQASIRIRDEEG